MCWRMLQAAEQVSCNIARLRCGCQLPVSPLNLTAVVKSSTPLQPTPYLLVCCSASCQLTIELGVLRCSLIEVALITASLFHLLSVSFAQQQEKSIHNHRCLLTGQADSRAVLDLKLHRGDNVLPLRVSAVCRIFFFF